MHYNKKKFRLHFQRRCVPPQPQHDHHCRRHCSLVLGRARVVVGSFILLPITSTCHNFGESVFVTSRRQSLLLQADHTFVLVFIVVIASSSPTCCYSPHRRLLYLHHPQFLSTTTTTKSCPKKNLRWLFSRTTQP